jgi:hypothetical protein
LSIDDRKGVCADIFKKPFQELGLMVRIINYFFVRCSQNTRPKWKSSDDPGLKESKVSFIRLFACVNNTSVTVLGQRFTSPNLE